MRKCYIVFSLILLSFYFLDAQENTKSLFDWQQISSLPIPQNDSIPLGLAGAFCGIHNNVMIIAGGTNSVRGGRDFRHNNLEEVYQDAIYICKKEENKYTWLSSKFYLEKPLAYGVSIPTKDGLICVGGVNQEDCSADVFYLKWDDQLQVIDPQILPALPVKLAHATGAMLDQIIYIAGGHEGIHSTIATKHFFALNLKNKNNPKLFKWKKLNPWDGPARIQATSAAQGNGLDNCFFLFSGHTVDTENNSKCLYDAYSYNPKTAQWKTLHNIPNTSCLSATPAIAVGAGHVFIFGGKEKNKTSSSKDILNYYTLTDTWNQIGKTPFNNKTFTNAFYWDKDIIIPGGQVKKDITSPSIQKIRYNVHDKAFGLINYLVLALYFAVLLWIGWYFSKRQKTTDDYFKGGGRIPWWAAGLSIFGTVLSAISFMAIPAKTFATDWSYLMYNFSPFFVAPIIVSLFLPFFHKLNLTTAYEYLEKRFNLTARLLGSISFMIYQFGRIAIVLYLPAIALNVVTGFPITWCIVLMGVVSVAYTMMGGIEGVIWTDVLQVIVLMGGAILCVGILLGNIDASWSEIIQQTTAANKYNVFDFDLDCNQSGFWVVLIGGIFSNVVFYGTDQTVVQRYMTATDIKSSTKSVWTNALLVIPSTLLFFVIGTLLFVYYKNAPEALQPGLEATDAIFPWYIVSELPQGVSGLLIAGIFAASMSSLSSSVNSVATAYTTDFHERFNWKGDSLKVARWSSLIIGIIGTLFALWMAHSEIKSLWDEFIKVVGLITGGLGGLFVLGMISKRANAKGALIGLVFSAFFQFWIVNSRVVHLMLFTTTGFFSCIIVGYVGSLFFKEK